MTTTKAITKKGILLDVASPTADEERMFEFLNSRVIGQKEACHAGVRIVTRSRSRLRTTGCAGLRSAGRTRRRQDRAGQAHLRIRSWRRQRLRPHRGGLLQNDHQVNALVGASGIHRLRRAWLCGAKRRAAEKVSCSRSSRKKILSWR
ncbi:MAG: hypothetical protein IPI39_26060 [Candidatus Obscuribacter sp.]|nr:hypothetical protein [Candidatus Obscuribacter sp.]